VTGAQDGLKPVRYGVIPAGGLGTRFLPISRTVPKELLPIIDTPIIEMIVSEMAASGIARVVVVIAPGKEALDAYFRRNERLERRLAVEFRQKEIELLKRPEKLAAVRTVVQEEAKGNGHAVLQARPLVGDEPFAMLWGDDIVLGAGPALAQLIEARDRLGGGSVVGCVRVPKAQASAYGVVAGTPVDERTLRVLAIVEKPKPEDARPRRRDLAHRRRQRARPERLARLGGRARGPALRRRRQARLREGLHRRRPGTRRHRARNAGPFEGAGLAPSTRALTVHP